MTGIVDRVGLHCSRRVSASDTETCLGCRPCVRLRCSGGGLLTSFARTLQLGGTQALILRLLLGRMSGRLSEQVCRQRGQQAVPASRR